MSKKLTKSLIESLEPRDKDFLVRDSELKGFHCKITPKGKKSFSYNYRFRGKERRPKIGDFGSITAEQARVVAKEWAGKIASGVDPHEEKKKAKTEITIKKLHEEYILKYGPKLKEKTLKENNYLWKNYIIPKLGNVKVNEISSSEVAKFHADLGDKKRTANRALEVLSKALSLAEDWKYREEGFNPCSKVKKYKENKKERFMTIAEIKKVMAILDDLELKRVAYQGAIDAIRLLIFTGCRRNEILELKWSYINFDSKRIDFPDSKTGKKTTPISDDAIEILKNIERIKGNPYVIPSTTKKGWHFVNLQKTWTNIRNAADLKEVRLHDIRHTYASLAVNNGISLHEVSKLLGHTNIKTTQRYAHLTEDSINKAANSIGSIIKKA